MHRFGILRFFYNYLMHPWQNLRKINFYFIKLATDFYGRPSYFVNEIFSTIEAVCRWIPFIKYFFILDHFDLFLSLLIGNCDICVDQKISFMNETKWNKILAWPKLWVQKNLPNFTAKISVSQFESDVQRLKSQYRSYLLI